MTVAASTTPGEPYVVKWGIIGTGWIAEMFCKDATFDRKVTDISHAIVAVGSRDTAKAAKFIGKTIPKGARAQLDRHYDKVPEACGSYEQVYAHPDVQIVYIATPHPGHFAETKRALEAGKHVLVEKPATLNAAEWAVLSALAKEKNLFLMEGLWTRFQPLMGKLQKALHEDKVIGDIRYVRSDFSMAFYDFVPDTHRTIALESAGGALYDLGAYAMLPALMALYESPANKLSPPENLQASMVKTRTGTDLSTSITMDFPRINGKAVCSTSFAYNSPKDEPAVIAGTKGEIVLHGAMSRPTGLTVKTIKGDPAPLPLLEGWNEPVEVNAELGPGFGLYFEADAVGKSLRDGKIENETQPHSRTAMCLALFDRVRELGGYQLPAGLERVGGPNRL